jgi:hypothetical protein
MNTAAWVGQNRRPNWPLIGFVVAHVAIVIATLLLIPIFGSRLPSETRVDESSWIKFELASIGFCLLFIARRREHRMSFALETALPFSIALVGLGFSMLLATVLINLDAHAYRRVFESGLWVGLVAGSVFMWLMLGRYLGAEAATNRLRRETASSRRSVWLAEVRVDRSWRVLYGAAWGVPSALLILLVVVSQPAAFTMGRWLAANLTLGMAVGERASVVITEGGVKVRGSLLFGGGWSLTMAEVSSARVVTAEPRPNFSMSRRGGRCVLRSGSALEITAATGGRYIVSLPEAEEAVVVLAALRGRNAAAGSAVLGDHGPARLAPQE